MTSKSSTGPRESSSRRGFLAGVFAIVSLGSGMVTSAVARAAARFSKAYAKYRYQPYEGRQCSKCEHFRPPHSCALVDGYIVPYGVCRFFRARMGMHPGMGHMRPSTKPAPGGMGY
jgi:hypothetical protein